MAALNDGHPLLHHLAWDVPDPIYFGLKCPDAQPDGLYQIWRFDTAQPMPIFDNVVCERASLQTIIRESGQALYFWPEGPCADRPTFVWDSESGEYTRGEVSCFIEVPYDG